MTTRRGLALLLGYWFAFAPAVFSIPATAMAAQAGMSDALAAGGCELRPDADQNGDICELACLAATLSATLADAEWLAMRIDADFRLQRQLAPQSCFSIPEPGPPKAAPSV